MKTQITHRNGRTQRALRVANGTLALVALLFFSQLAQAQMAGSGHNLNQDHISIDHDNTFSGPFKIGIYENGSHNGVSGDWSMLRQEGANGSYLGMYLWPYLNKPIVMQTNLLEVAGSIKFTGVMSSTNQISFRPNAAITDQVWINTGGIGIGGSGHIHLAGTERKIYAGNAGVSSQAISIYQNTNATDSRSWIELFGTVTGRVGELALTGTYIDFRSNSTTTSPGNINMRLNSSGQLIVGGAEGTGLAAWDKLEVKGRIWSNSTQGGLWLSSHKTAFWGVNDAKADGAVVGLWTSGKNWDAFSINTSNGNIGIGTSEASEMLELKSGSTASPTLSFHKTSTATYKVGIDGTVFKIAAMDNGAGGHTGSFESSDTQVLAMTATGSVGIGTVNPGTFKLAVNGTIRAKEVVVESGWSDFVFEPGYRLRSLNEVENFITENGHLPDVPSAQEVQENGIGVAQASTVLLQKVEELTLYLIEMKKENEALRARLDQLEK